MLKGKRRSLFLLSFTLLVVMLGYGVAMPMLPFYIERFGVGGREYGWMMSTYSLMQLICAPIWGLLSDRFGRKPIFSIGVIGYAIAFFLFGLADSFAMLFMARVLSGMLSSATMPTAMAYIGDHTEADEKSQAMGQLGAMVGTGVILGPIMGALLAGFAISVPFFIGSGLAFIAFLLVLFLLPEDRQVFRARAQATKEENVEKAGVADFARDYLAVLFGPAGLLLLLIFIMSFGLANFQNMIGLYVVDKLGFDTHQVSSIWVVMGVMMIAVQGGLTGWISKRLSEWTIIRLGLLGGTLGFLFVSLAHNYLTTLLALAFFMLALTLISPALNAAISRYGGERQGALMGLNSAMTSLGRVLGPLWGGYIYEIDVVYSFYSGAITLVVGLVVSLVGIRKD